MEIISNYKELYNTSSSLIFLDLETTGLNPVNDQIIEIGAIKVVNGEIVDKISELLNPGCKIPFYATRVNGITDSMVSDKRDSLEGVNDFISLVDPDSIIIAHNVKFDIGFINNYLIESGKKPLNNRMVDTVRMARKAFPGRKKYSLGMVAEHLNIEVKSAHRAYDDTRVCYEIYLQCINELTKEK